MPHEIYTTPIRFIWCESNHSETRNTFSWVDIILILYELKNRNEPVPKSKHLLARLLCARCCVRVCKQANEWSGGLVWAKIIIIECEKWVEAILFMRKFTTPNRYSRTHWLTHAFVHSSTKNADRQKCEVSITLPNNWIMNTTRWICTRF